MTIVSVYNREDWEEVKNKVREIAEEKMNESLIIGRDFNARIAGENDEEEWYIKRRSKDRVTNSRGREILNLVAEIRGRILNGTTEGDKEGNYTYVGPRGGSVIDYVIVNEKGQENIRQYFRVGERVDSDP